MLELKLVVAAIYTNYTTTIVDDEDIEQLDSYSSGPKADKLILQFKRTE
jgi:unspecific monooxygenase